MNYLVIAFKTFVDGRQESEKKFMSCDETEINNWILNLDNTYHYSIWSQIREQLLPEKSGLTKKNIAI